MTLLLLNSPVLKLKAWRGLLLAAIIPLMVCGCPDAGIGGTPSDYDGAWTVVVTDPVTAEEHTVMTLTITNGVPAKMSPPGVPTIIGFPLDGQDHSILVLGTFAGTGTLTGDGDAVEIVINLTITPSAEAIAAGALEGTQTGSATVVGTLSGDTITGTLTATGTSLGVSTDAPLDVTMTR